ncbi:hypothetical protein Tco_1127167 [Tanacetum coccineum]
MERIFLSSGGRGVKQKKGVTTVNAAVNIENTKDKSGNNDDSGSSKNVVTNSTNAIHNLELVDDHSTRNVVDTSLGATIGVHLMVNDVNTDNINLETPIELNKGDNFVLFATLLKGDMSKKSVNFHTFNYTILWVVSERLANSASGFFLGKHVAYPFISKDGLDAILEHGPWSSYARTLIELQAYIALKDTIIMAMPELVGEGFYMCTMRVEYEWKPPRQATRGVLVDPKVSFKSTKQIYRHVSNNNSASTSGKKKQAEVSRQEGSNSNPFDALTSMLNDDVIDKLECQILDGNLIFVDDDGNPHAYTGNVDSESEVKVVFDKTANLMGSTSFKGRSYRGYGTNSLLELWSKTKRDDDYDPYDDDLYESHDMYDYLQAICYDLEIMFCGQMKE